MEQRVSFPLTASIEWSGFFLSGGYVAHRRNKKRSRPATSPAGVCPHCGKALLFVAPATVSPAAVAPTKPPIEAPSSHRHTGPPVSHMISCQCGHGIDVHRQVSRGDNSVSCEGCGAVHFLARFRDKATDGA